MSKFIFITGGVVSSLGKGITAASVGQILKSRGLKVFIQKFDPYINVDPGTMSPFQHGEVYVTDDGAETDLDLGHYERFVDEKVSKYSSVSTGKIYQKVIENEREGLYYGATIQVIPHITNEIKQKLVDAAKYSNADIIITEIGGTVGDIESLPYLEAIRQARRDFGYKNTLYIHNTLVPYLKAAKELKTKPTQHSVKELRSLGIQPDVLILRSEVQVPSHAKDKIALFSDIEKEAVFESIDVDVIYQNILDMKEQKIDDFILKHFKIENLVEPDLSKWVELIEKIRKLKKKVKVAIVGKYVSLHDAYLSLVESLKHSGYYHNVDIELTWIDALKINKDNAKYLLKDVSGIVVTDNDIADCYDGKITAIKYARENNVSFLGLSNGLQLALMEYGRNVIKISKSEIDKLNVITDDQFKGAYRSNLLEGTKVQSIYNLKTVKERYRYNNTFNLQYKERFLSEGDIVFSAYSSNDVLSAIELISHKWFIAVKYHPEFLSRPLKSHPLFNSFVESLLK